MVHSPFGFPFLRFSPYIQHFYSSEGFEKLNVIQSIVFEQAYKTKENLLICAPMGGGNTNIAMLTILNTIHEHQNSKGEIMKDDFKIIYIAPMKALATEMTDSFGKRLAPLGLKVKELTGDTQLSRNEVADTQMLVLTPEKWDVITRKSSSDNSIINTVRLLIIDEVHLLHDERGPVIETPVARTLRQVEMSQSGIRIVGLSATLPNYIDVARFLRVNPYKGLFFFERRFKPVPLTQKFIGTRKTGNFRDNMTLMDNVCYDEVIDFVKRGHQVLVFVNTRNGTAKLGEAFCARASVLGQMDLFLPKDRTSSKYVQADKAINLCRNRAQISPLFQRGMGIHHAGLCRQDRILMERCFAEGHVSVLFCTATLAWGVNLPAHAVVIKGTDVFDAEKGVFADLGVLDVQQIFGRAGRPQFENEGHGIIITTRDKIDKYLTMLVHQNPIESNFYTRLHDNLNAEVALGTVSTVDEGVEWLTYTYMYTRALKNPMAYGIAYNAVERDPNLRDHIGEVIRNAAIQLDQNKMIRYDMATEYLNSTDLGRIASNFYVKYETIQLWNEAEKGVGLPVTFTSFMPDDMVLGLVSMATEFANVKVREEEINDLEELMSYGCMMNVRGGGLASVAGKVNVLLQSLISRTSTRNSALMSEQLYVQQNAGRLCRAMFEMVLKNGWSQAANAFLGIAKCVEKQMWMNQCSLRQFIQIINIPITWIEKIERKKARESDLLELSPKDLGYMFSCDGERLYTYLQYLPRMEVTARFKPITYTIVQVEVTLTPTFLWNDAIHGKSGLQSFYLVLENLNENLIIHQERIGIRKMKVTRAEPQFIVFTIPIVDCQLTNNFQLRLASEYFVTEDVVVPMSLHNCILSKSFKSHTDLLDLEPLPIKEYKNPTMINRHNRNIQRDPREAARRGSNRQMAPDDGGKLPAENKNMYSQIDKVSLVIVVGIVICAIGIACMLIEDGPRVSIVRVEHLDNPAMFKDKFKLEITFEVFEHLPHDLEWELVYVGSGTSRDYDQVLNSTLVKPIPEGRHKFVFDADHPDISKIPTDDIVGVSVLLLRCKYNDQEFINMRWSVVNEYTDDELKENPPAQRNVDKLSRKVETDDLRVTTFPIRWTDEDPISEPALDEEEKVLEDLETRDDVEYQKMKRKNTAVNRFGLSVIYEFDFNRVRDTEQEAAKKMFKGKSEKKAKDAIQKSIHTEDPSDIKKSGASGAPGGRNLNDEDRVKIKEAIKNAKSLSEVNYLHSILASNKIPEKGWNRQMDQKSADEPMEA